MGVLCEANSKDVFHFFEEICKIPHGSGNTDAIAAYLVNTAKAHNYPTYRDKANNVVVTIPATSGYEQSETMILQAHTDMVCEKDPGVTFDFTKDPISLVVEGDVLRADGTTLGGDDGISVAMMLAIINDSTLKHPKLELLFTADEEIGMLGAFAFDCSHLTGHRLINLDSEYERILMCSCAGGVNVYSALPVEREEVKLSSLSIDITDLASGHSGVEIGKGRANANVLIARMLDELCGKFDCRLLSLNGGSRETAIAAVSHATLAAPEALIHDLKKAAESFGKVICQEYTSTEPKMQVAVTVADAATIGVLTKKDTQLVKNLLLSLPDGVQMMSPDMPGLVQTSLNFGILKLEETQLTFANTIRSSVNTQKEWIVRQVMAVVQLAGGSSKIVGNYPGWSYNPNSVVKDTIVRAYEEMYGKKPSIDAVHAGIECGLFADSIPDLDCVSIGPDMADVHTPREHLSISSAERTYDLLKKVLEESK